MSDGISETEIQQQPQFKDLRAQNVPADFLIMVGKKSFEVHQETLKNHTKYFENLTLYYSVKYRQGYAKLQNVTEYAVEICVEYFYTGKIDFSAEKVLEVLAVAELFQLPEIKDHCLPVCENELSRSNCIQLYCLGKENGRISLTDRSKDILVKLSKKEIKESHTLKNSQYWTAVKIWIEHDFEARQVAFEELVTVMDWEKFPDKRFLEEIWEHPLFKTSKNCQILIFQSAFTDVIKLENKLSTENYFVVRKTSTLCSSFLIKQIKELLLDFLALNFVVLCEKREFLLMEEEEIVELFKNKLFIYLIVDEWRWVGAMKWIKHDSKRLSVFLEIMQTFKLDRMSEEFLERNVKAEMTTFQEAYSQYLLKTMLSKNKARYFTSRFAVEQGHGHTRIHVYDINKRRWESPVDEVLITAKLRIKARKLWYKLPSGRWNEIQVVKPMDQKIQALIHDKAKICSVYDDSQDSVVIACGKIVGLKVMGPPKLSVFNIETQSWDIMKNIQIPLDPFAAFPVMKGLIYNQCGDGWTRSISIEDEKFVSLPLHNKFKQIFSFEEMLLGVDRTGIIVMYDEVCHKWTELTQIPNDSTVSRRNFIETGIPRVLTFNVLEAD